MNTSSCTPAPRLRHSLKQTKPVVMLSIGTHLGSWLPLLPLRSSPPRAALPVGHKAAVMNIIIFTALRCMFTPVSRGLGDRSWCTQKKMFSAPESLQQMETRRKWVKSPSKCGKKERTAQPLCDRRWGSCAHPQQGETKAQPVQPPPSNSPSRSMLRQRMEKGSHMNMGTHLSRRRRGAHVYNPLGLYWGL